jgi:hypothetical protein
LKWPLRRQKSADTNGMFAFFLAILPIGFSDACATPYYLPDGDGDLVTLSNLVFCDLVANAGFEYAGLAVYLEGTLIQFTLFNCQVLRCVNSLSAGCAGVWAFAMHSISSFGFTGVSCEGEGETFFRYSVDTMEPRPCQINETSGTDGSSGSLTFSCAYKSPYSGVSSETMVVNGFNATSNYAGFAASGCLLDAYEIPVIFEYARFHRNLDVCPLGIGLIFPPESPASADYHCIEFVGNDCSSGMGWPPDCVIGLGISAEFSDCVFNGNLARVIGESPWGDATTGVFNRCFFDADYNLAEEPDLATLEFNGAIIRAAADLNFGLELCPFVATASAAKTRTATIARTPTPTFAMTPEMMIAASTASAAQSVSWALEKEEFEPRTKVRVTLVCFAVGVFGGLLVFTVVELKELLNYGEVPSYLADYFSS